MLTYIQINAAKPREKAWTLTDSQGLYLVIQPNGSKLWRFNYRFLDKQKKLHLGGWPTISLAEARVRRDEAKKKIAERYLRERGVTVSSSHFLDSFATGISLVASTGGLTLLPAYVEKLLPRSVVSRPLVGTAPVIEIAAGYRADNPSPVLHDFLQHIDWLIAARSAVAGPSSTSWL
jgi:DNA-binding transcriptional LysR family regulator